LPEHFEVFRASGKGDLGNTRFSQGLWISVPNRPISLSDGKINAKTNQPSNPLKRRLRGHLAIRRLPTAMETMVRKQLFSASTNFTSGKLHHGSTKYFKQYD
jgi:hypothetical protein